MFWKKKQNPVINKIFGEVKHASRGWETVSKTKITLWNKTYDIDILAVVKTKDEEINGDQERSFESFKNIMMNQKKKIEKIIMDEFGSEDELSASARFIPTELIINVTGECALYAEDDEEEYGKYDDWDEGFALAIIPELKIYSKERYDGYIFGGGGL